MTETNEKVFSDPQTEMSDSARQILYADLSRVLYFVRITELHLVGLGKSRYLHPNLKPAKILEMLKGYDQRVRAAMPVQLNRSLTAELSKDKVFDISNFVELAGKVHGEVYESIMSGMVDVVEKLGKTKLNPRKYNAIFRFLIAELDAEDGGETAIWYNDKTDSITFKLTQPKSKNNDIK